MDERDTLRAALRTAITNAYYDARNAGETMEIAADRATDGVLAALTASATDEHDLRKLGKHIAETWNQMNRNTIADVIYEEWTTGDRKWAERLADKIMARLPALAASATDEPERNPLVPTDEELRAMWEALPSRFPAVPEALDTE